VVAGGWQMSTHANGDAAINNTIDAYENALAAAEPEDIHKNDHRLVIQHCQTPTGALPRSSSFCASV
jgi:predicted amidohydrolase YtcJ